MKWPWIGVALIALVALMFTPATASARKGVNPRHDAFAHLRKTSRHAGTGAADNAAAAAATTGLSYEVTDVSPPTDSWESVFDMTVNPNGVMTMNGYDGAGDPFPTTGFLYVNGNWTDLNAATHCMFEEGGGCYFTEATGVNGNGQVSAYQPIHDTPGIMQALRYDSATGQEHLLQPGTTAYGINASGQLVGWFTTPSGAFHAYYWDGKTIHDMGTLGGTDSVAYATSANGQAVGCSQVANGHWHPFLYSAGKMKDLGLPAGLTDACAYSVNSTGEIIGTDGASQQLYPGQPAADRDCHGWIRSGAGKYTVLSVPAGADCLTVRHVTNTGDVVGTYRNTTQDYGSVHGFIYSGGVLHTLTGLTPFDPGYNIRFADGNNLHGQIAASGDLPGDFSYTDRGLLLTPITITDENNAAIKYSGSWTRISTPAYGGHVERANAAGASISFAVTVKHLCVIGPIGPALGNATISADGSFIGNLIETQGSATKTRQRLFCYVWPAAGKHTITVNVASANFELDAFTAAQN